MTAKRVTARKRKATKPSRRSGKRKNAITNPILAWEDDPESGLAPIERPAPNLASQPFPTRIEGQQAPPPKIYKKGTLQFRYWAAADALRRASDFWGGILGNIPWQPGGTLPVSLDRGQDLNAFYDRVGLRFFHGAAGNQTVFSGESPDVVCHELGHAILDSIRPELWDAGSSEIGAFHESFADISAILSAVQLPSVRTAVLQEINSKLFRSSRLSRLAEQLGRAIRLVRPDLADPDCLRNAVNSFFYREPETLPPTAPSSLLSSEPHSFSRVFTAGFFGTLANMLALSGSQPTEQQLQSASVDAAKLLTNAVLASPVVPNYYSQVAGHMVDSDQALFAGKFRDAITSSFIHCGVLSMQSLRAVTAARPSAPRLTLHMLGAPTVKAAGARKAAPVERRSARAVVEPGAALPPVAISGDDLGLDGEKVLVRAASETPRLPALSAAITGDSLPGVTHDKAARSFLEDLLQRGHVSIAAGGRYSVSDHPMARKTHELVRKQGGLELVRKLFDCGWTGA